MYAGSEGSSEYWCLQRRYVPNSHVLLHIHVLFYFYTQEKCTNTTWLCNIHMTSQETNILVSHILVVTLYEGCSNMNASSFITFFTFMLRQNVIHFWKELFVAFKMAPNIKKHPLYFSSYRPLYTGHSCILKFF